MATKKTTATTETTERSTHRWTQPEMEFLISLDGLGRNEIEKRFRAKFPNHKGSQQSLIGKLYSLTHRPSSTAKTPELAKQAAEVKIARLEDELEQARADLVAIEDGTYWDDAPKNSLMEQLNDATYREVQAAAKDAGVSAKGSRNDILERLAEAV